MVKNNVKPKEKIENKMQSCESLDIIKKKMRSIETIFNDNVAKNNESVIS